jgi:glycosyltransferase involved in cell wall biosynthesis
MPGHKGEAERRSIIFGGGFYPWLNPMPALLDLAGCLGEGNDLYLEIFGGSHETNPEEKKEFDTFKKEMQKNPRVTFHGTIPREELLRWYEKAVAAFEVMPRNPERELAFTTRTIEFLWAGLPVIYNNYAEISEFIDKYEAGWLVQPGNIEDLKRVVRIVAEDKEAVMRASENAQRLVGENLTYEKVIGPLAEFCRNPRMREHKHDGNPLMLQHGLSRPSGIIQNAYFAYKTMPKHKFVVKCLQSAVFLAKRKVIRNHAR